MRPAKSGAEIGSREAVERITDQLIGKARGRLPVDITAVAEREGVAFQRRPLGPVLGAFLGVLNEGTPALAFINSRLGRRRKRFTEAHELAHAILDGRSGLGNDEGLRAGSRLAQLARKALPVRYVGFSARHTIHEQFAASVLMPRVAVHSVVEALPPTATHDQVVAALARACDVTVLAATVRLDELGSAKWRRDHGRRPRVISRGRWARYRAAVRRGDVAGMYRAIASFA